MFFFWLTYKHITHTIKFFNGRQEGKRAQLKYKTTNKQKTFISNVLEH